MDKYNSGFARLVGTLNGAKGGYAVTISSTCTLYSYPKDRVDEKWRKHEEQHKVQIIEAGWWKFMYLYFKYSLTVGYYNNPFEVAAREASLK